MFTIDHEFEIAAPAETVWQVITDLDRYGEWNPFVVAAESTLQPGDEIRMRVKLIGPPQKQVEVMTAYSEGEGFAYRMKPFPLGALASARHHHIESVGEGRSLYRSHFELRGWLAPVVRGLLGSPLQRGFDGMAEGIRRRAEALAAGEPSGFGERAHDR